MGDYSKPIRVGLIGYGLAGAFIHAPLIEAAEGYRIVAISTSRTTGAANRRDAPRVVADPFEVCLSDDVDLVVVASPNNTHLSLGIAALKAGKAVVIDKPMAPSSAEGSNLIITAAQAERPLTVFHNRRGDGSFLAVRQILDEGLVGTPFLLESRWDRFQPQAQDVWRNSASPGAGILWDLGPHLLDQALQLWGTPQTVTADIARQRADAAADDYFELALHYGNARYILSASSLIAAPRPRFSIHGAEGSAVVPAYDPIEAALRTGRHPGDPDFFKDIKPLTVDFWTSKGHQQRNFPHGDWVAFYRDLRVSLMEGRPPSVSADEALEGIRIIETAHGASGIVSPTGATTPV